MKRFVFVQVSFAALSATAMAQEAYVSPGVAYTGHYFDGRWDSGIGSEITGGYASYENPFNMGGFLQIEWYGEGRIRVGVGLQNSWFVGTELGMSIRFEDEHDPIWGLQVGPYASAVGAHIAGRMLIEQGYGVSGGASVYLKPVTGFRMLTYAQGSGRPLRTADGAQIVSQYVVLERVGAPVHDEAGRWWLQNALAEHGAIGAFLRLAGWLRQHGAPAELIRRSVAAAEEEARHADACFAIAGRLLGLRLAPVAAEVPVGDAPDLVALAVMNLNDGRYAEGVAAREAAAALPHAVDPDVRTTLTAIAAEEASHARLADDIEIWLRAVGGAPVDAALEAAMIALEGDQSPAPRLPHAPDWGLPTRSMQLQARAAAHAALDAPLSAVA